MTDPHLYDSWYYTPRGRWIARREFSLLMRLLKPHAGCTLLDVGSGTGYFTRRFAANGLHVTGLDSASAMLQFAREQGGDADYVQGDAATLPFADGCFDYCTAITSLCFVADPARTLAEMWRVCRRGLALGLLNRHSLLYLVKRGRGGYRGARWDTMAAVRGWCRPLQPAPRLENASAVWLPGGGRLARGVESWLPEAWSGGGFLAVALHRR
ncbi:MAG TPA: class I SAM-dependent methyltransferase [Gammaproteobacteria bacterium]|nr:class I SAM-dependent methyltransferase [Gammaproteobacteria bacterium]